MTRAVVAHKVRPSVTPLAQNALFRRPQSQNALFRRMRFSSPGQTSSHLTEKRILCAGPHVKAHSAPGFHGEAHSSPAWPSRVRFSVDPNPQSALFRKVRFFSPAQTSSHLTERRSLCVGPYVKAQSARWASRKSAFWPNVSRKGAVCGSHVAQTAPFGHVAAWEAWRATPRQAAGHYGKWPNWANASEQPPARLRGGVAPGSASLGLEPDFCPGGADKDGHAS